MLQVATLFFLWFPSQLADSGPYSDFQKTCTPQTSSFLVASPLTYLPSPTCSHLFSPAWEHLGNLPLPSCTSVCQVNAVCFSVFYLVTVTPFHSNCFLWVCSFGPPLGSFWCLLVFYVVFLFLPYYCSILSVSLCCVQHTLLISVLSCYCLGHFLFYYGSWLMLVSCLRFWVPLVTVPIVYTCVLFLQLFPWLPFVYKSYCMSS